MNVIKESNAVTAKVTVISLWSKCEGVRGHENNATYEVEVPAGGDHIQTLERAFARTNQDDRPKGHEVCSTSSGDILVLDGRHYLVENSGYHELTLTESEMVQKLTSRDTSLGFDFMAKNHLL